MSKSICIVRMRDYVVSFPAKTKTRVNMAVVGRQKARFARIYDFHENYDCMVRSGVKLLYFSRTHTLQPSYQLHNYNVMIMRKKHEAPASPYFLFCLNYIRHNNFIQNRRKKKPSMFVFKRGNRKLYNNISRHLILKCYYLF